uniref:Uncharacterized protein n=1 Tax=Meloidogyne enterolobii TaxID=390850 RepID=A0A6V7U238_MELEN|nr:unnamed protein product [Meloidogyne enterolobii]
MAIESAQLEEKEILDGCAIKNAYMIAMPHVIRRLRNFMANHENPQRNPGFRYGSLAFGWQKAKRIAQQ